MTSDKNRLFRYTTLPVLLDILQQRHITLLSPKSWVDRNDAYSLEQYQLQKNLRSLLAVCFTASGERFHHWHVFCRGVSGVCIEFNREYFLNSFAGLEGFRHQPVTYSYVQDVEQYKHDPSSWPFLKRYAFKDENEYRIIFESSAEELHEKPVPIDLTSIKSVTFSPWLPSSIAPSVWQGIR